MDIQEHPDFTELTVSELKVQLKAHGLKINGKKQDLIDRLNDFFETGEHNGEFVLVKEPKKKTKKTPGKRKAKGQTKFEDTLKSVLLDGNHSLANVLAVICKVYNVTEEQLNADPDILENTPEKMEVPQTEEELNKMKIAELKMILKSQNKKVGGKKEELVARILEDVDHVTHPTDTTPTTPDGTPDETPDGVGIPEAGVPAEVVQPVEIEDSPINIPTNTSPIPAIPAIPVIPGASPVNVPGLPQVPAQLEEVGHTISPVPEIPAIPTIPTIPTTPTILATPTNTNTPIIVAGDEDDGPV